MAGYGCELVSGCERLSADTPCRQTQSPAVKACRNGLSGTRCALRSWSTAPGSGGRRARSPGNPEAGLIHFGVVDGRWAELAELGDAADRGQLAI